MQETLPTALSYALTSRLVSRVAATQSRGLCSSPADRRCYTIQILMSSASNFRSSGAKVNFGNFIDLPADPTRTVYKQVLVRDGLLSKTMSLAVPLAVIGLAPENREDFCNHVELHVLYVTGELPKSVSLSPSGGKRRLGPVAASLCSVTVLCE